MSTRRLILLALACGIAILVAGGVKLLQVAGDQPRVTVLALGERAQVGDVTAAVLAVRTTAEALLVDVEVGGLGGVDPGAGWVVLADGQRREAMDGATQCPVAVDDQPVACTVTFPPADRVQAVAYARGGEQRQWAPRA